MTTRQKRHNLSACIVLSCLSVAVQTKAASFNTDFEKPSDCATFHRSGANVVLDATQAYSGKSSLKIPPKTFTEIIISGADDAGSVEFWVYDSLELPSNPKIRHVGPRWGVKMANGRMLTVGCFYAPYLSGNATYTLSESPDTKSWLHKVTYLGESKRTKGWHKWSFTFDTTKGLTIAMDGKDVNAKRKRFDWNKSQVPAFSSVVFFGDDNINGTTLWIDGLTATSGGSMKIAPTPPPPPPPPPPPAVVPETDPVAAKPIKLAYANPNVHPRVLFGPERVAEMRAFIKTPAGKPYLKTLLNYRGACKPPKNNAFLRDATDGQRQGLWRLPTVALHYLLTGDKASFNDTKGFLELFLSLENWETGDERDSGMSSANIMIGAALAFDWLYNDLDPAFREKFRQKLWLHARKQYYGGHLRRNPGTHYWQGDPQNNHRWHRNAGMTLAALAAAKGTPDEQWFLNAIKEELAYITKWLPEDGTSHESASYLVFGAAHLVLGLQAGDRGFGTKNLATPFFKNVGAFRIQSLLPGLTDGFSFGDGSGLGNYNNFLLNPAATFKQPALMGAVAEMRKAAPSGYGYAWFDLIWIDPTLKTAPITQFATTGLYPDIGTLFIRESWDEDSVAAMFRCGPFGGYRLNEFRNENKFAYINVAHDDPDANSFTLHMGTKTMAETDRYSKHKQSKNHNTVLVNGIGQEVRGRKESMVWSQPATGDVDMTDMAVLTAWKQTPAVTLIEGEAAGSYLALNDKRRNVSRPALDTFRRTFIWVEGEYVLMLDDLRAPKSVTYDWLMQGPELVETDASAMRYNLVSGDTKCAFQVAASMPLATQIRTSPADSRGQALGWKQLVATANTDKLRIASVYMPWGGKANVALKTIDVQRATVSVVTPSGKTETWAWTCAVNRTTPSLIKRTQGPAFKISANDRPPAAQLIVNNE